MSVSKGLMELLQSHVHAEDIISLGSPLHLWESLLDMSLQLCCLRESESFLRNSQNILLESISFFRSWLHAKDPGKGSLSHCNESEGQTGQTVLGNQHCGCPKKPHFSGRRVHNLTKAHIKRQVHSNVTRNEAPVRLLANGKAKQCSHPRKQSERV